MNLRHLAVFHAVAKTGSINGAAPLLHTSQPAISRELRTLEDRTGHTLFDRMPRGMRLTEAGQRLFEYAERIFAIEQAAERAMRDLGTLQGGELLIGASNTIGTYLVPTYISRFAQQYPKVKIKLEIQNSEKVIRGIAEFQYDLGFAEGFVDASDVDLKEVARDLLLPVVAPDHPLAKRRRLSAQELAQWPLMLREPGSGTREMVERAFTERGLEINCSVQVSTSEALKRAAMAGSGIAWISRFWVVDEIRDRQLVTLPMQDLRIERSLYAVRRRGRHLSKSSSIFLRESGLEWDA